MYEYQKYGRYYAQVAGEMEDIAAAEFVLLGAKNVRSGYRGVSFEADQATIYLLNYCSRFATRILAPLLTFDCHTTKYLTRTAQNIHWEELLTLDQTFAISASVGDSQITHSLYASQCLKDGIADYFTAKYGRRPNVNTETPDLALHLRIYQNKAIISVDTSGLALHKRGYRIESGRAPMQETLAAALIHFSGWTGETSLWDPMCGSGTLLAEALMHYCHIPAQYLRPRFGFQQLPDFDPVLWASVREKADSAIRPLPENCIFGSDKDCSAIEHTRTNLAKLPYGDRVVLRQMPFSHQTAYENATIVMNPPYGIRLGDRDSVALLYKEFGDFLKKNCNGTSASMYIGDSTLRKSFGLKSTRRKKINNASLEGEMLCIDSYRVAFRGTSPKEEVTSLD